MQHAFMIFPFNCGIFLCPLHGFRSLFLDNYKMLYSNGISHNNDSHCPTLKRACRRGKLWWYMYMYFPSTVAFLCLLHGLSSWFFYNSKMFYINGISFYKINCHCPHILKCARALKHTHTHIHTRASYTH